MKILDFFLFLGVIFALLDPDPQFECGSGSGSETLNILIWQDPDEYPQFRNPDTVPTYDNSLPETFCATHLEMVIAALKKRCKMFNKNLDTDLNSIVRVP